MSETPLSSPLQKKEAQSNLDVPGSLDSLRTKVDGGLSDYLDSVSQSLSSPDALKTFFNKHSESNYTSYEDWNHDFCEQVLDKTTLSLAEERLAVQALQRIIHEKVGGFSSKPNLFNSFDGKFGPFTLRQFLAYQNATSSQEVVPTEVAPVVPVFSEDVSSSESKETYNPENTFWVGDSYGQGFTDFGRTPHKNVQVSRPFYYQTPQKNSKWKDNDVLTHALAFLNDSSCKKLVVIGGLNDFGMYGENAEKTADTLQEKYKELFDLAEEKGTQLDVFDIPITPKHVNNPAIVAAINRFNLWLSDQAKEKSFLHVSDTDGIVAGRWANKLHPTNEVYRDMFDMITKV